MLSLHGVTLAVDLPQEVDDWFYLDFRRFLAQAPGPPSLLLTLELDGRPLPAGLRETFRGNHFVIFDRPGQRVVAYPNCGSWLGWEPASDRLSIHARDPQAGYLRLQLAIHSRLGELLERRGLHRVHGLGVGGREGGVLILLPPGGGKSTLSWQLVSSGRGLNLYSEDTPLVDARGRLWDYPFRLALRDAPQGESLPLRQGKWLVDPDREGHRWGRGPIACREILVGGWTTDPRPRLEPLGLLGKLACLARDGWLGYGVPQLVELWWPSGLRDGLDRSRLLAGRGAAILALAARARGRRLWLSPQAEANYELLCQEFA